MLGWRPKSQFGGHSFLLRRPEANPMASAIFTHGVPSFPGIKLRAYHQTHHGLSHLHSRCAFISRHKIEGAPSNTQYTGLEAKISNWRPQLPPAEARGRSNGLSFPLRRLEATPMASAIFTHGVPSFPGIKLRAHHQTHHMLGWRPKSQFGGHSSLVRRLEAAPIASAIFTHDVP